MSRVCPVNGERCERIDCALIEGCGAQAFAHPTPEPKVDVILIERPPSGSEEHIGDGLYASFDGYQFKLRAPRDGGDHEVYLEPSVLAAFLDFAKRAGVLR